MKGLLERARDRRARTSTRPRRRRSRRRRRSARSGDDRAQDDPCAVLGRARHPAGQSRPVPRRGRRPSSRSSRSIRSTSTSRCRSSSVAELRVGAAGAVAAADDLAIADSRGRSRPSIPSSIRATRNVQVQATLAQPGRQAASRHVRADERRDRRDRARSSRSRRPPSATRRTAIRSSSSRTEGPERRDLPRRAPAVREARRRDAAIRWRSLSGLKAGEEVVTSGVFKLRNGAAVQVNNKVQPGNNPTPKPENS